MASREGFLRRFFSRSTFVALLPLFLIPLALLGVYLASMKERLWVGVREFLWGPSPAWMAGAVVVFIFLAVVPFVLSLQVRGLRYVSEIIQGADNRPSTSKIQFLWWTIAVLFSFAALKVRQLQLSSVWESLDIPWPVMVAIGASALTAVGAKAIAVNQSDKNHGAPNPAPPVEGAGGGEQIDPTADALRQIAADSPTGLTARTGQDVGKQLPPAGDLRYAVTDDAGQTDFSKIQLLTWTVIAIALYLWHVGRDVLSGGAPTGLPSIDSSLVVLMGLSQGTYIGRKLVPDNTPWLLGLDPKAVTAAEVAAGWPVTIRGKNFGGTQGGGMVTINEVPVTVAVARWSPEEITFVLKATLPAGTAYVGVVVGGQMSANALPLTVTA